MATTAIVDNDAEHGVGTNHSAMSPDAYPMHHRWSPPEWVLPASDSQSKAVIDMQNIFDSIRDPKQVDDEVKDLPRKKRNVVLAQERAKKKALDRAVEEVASFVRELVKNNNEFEDLGEVLPGALSQLGKHSKTMNLVLSRAMKEKFIGLDFFCRKGLIEQIEKYFPVLIRTEIWSGMKLRGAKNQEEWGDLLTSVGLYYMLYEVVPDGESRGEAKERMVRAKEFAKAMLESEEDGTKRKLCVPCSAMRSLHK